MQLRKENILPNWITENCCIFCYEQLLHLTTLTLVPKMVVFNICHISQWYKKHISLNKEPLIITRHNWISLNNHLKYHKNLTKFHVLHLSQAILVSEKWVKEEWSIQLHLRLIFPRNISFYCILGLVFWKIPIEWLKYSRINKCLLTVNCWCLCGLTSLRCTRSWSFFFKGWCLSKNVNL